MKIKKISKEESKGWTKVHFELSTAWDKTWYPRLDEISMMLRAMYHSENKKYPTGRGGDYMLDYFNDIITAKKMNPSILKMISEKYKLPKKDSDEEHIKKFIDII